MEIAAQNRKIISTLGNSLKIYFMKFNFYLRNEIYKF